MPEAARFCMKHPLRRAVHPTKWCSVCLEAVEGPLEDSTEASAAPAPASKYQKIWTRYQQLFSTVGQGARPVRRMGTRF
jgi:hypothetical protein